MRRYHMSAIGVATVVVLTIFSGLIHGRMSNRWGPSPDLLAAAKRLESLPEAWGSWRLQASGELGETAQDQLQCAGSIVNTYTNQETGDTVNATVLVGPPGPLSVHTPEVCFSSRNHTQIEERRSVPVADSQGSANRFWAVTFRSNDLDGCFTRVYWAWSTGGPWSAPERPRFEFGACPYLYKIQLAAALPPGTDPEKTDPCKEFLREFLPEVKQYLVEPPGN